MNRLDVHFILSIIAAMTCESMAFFESFSEEYSFD